MKNNISYLQFLKAVDIVKAYQNQLELNTSLSKEAMATVSPFFKLTKNTLLGDLDCTVRLHNALRANGEKCGVPLTHNTKVSELSKLSLSKFANSRCVGKNVLEELNEICHFLNISLKP
jgi:hypothetical protein